MIDIMNAEILYLHGFASSPNGNKARFFAQKCQALNITLHRPDLNVPSFETLTLSAQLERIAKTVRGCDDQNDVYLIGSSMGGLATLHFMDAAKKRYPEAARVSKIILLAPALDFMANRARQLGNDGLEKWRQQGYWEALHYRDNQSYQIHYQLAEDLAQYDSFAVALSVPTLIIHGKQDASVPYQDSVRFAENRPTVSLDLIASDHTLGNALPHLWDQTRTFFELES